MYGWSERDAAGWPEPSLRHLERLCDSTGLIEHALRDRPRPGQGYCTDDAGRALALACRLPQDPFSAALAELTLSFLERAHLGGGRFRLRLRPSGPWDHMPSDDACGRAIYGLATAAADAPWPDVRQRAAALFGAAAGFRSPWPRATAYATLGAAALFAAAEGGAGARARAGAASGAGARAGAGAAPGAGAVAVRAASRALLVDAAQRLAMSPRDGGWPWPEERLSYANALLPGAALAAAVALGEDRLGQAALEVLEWLVATETREHWFSFTPVGGRGPKDVPPGFDQQPIEAWAMADACARAWKFTGDPRWADTLLRAGAWFTGLNDVGVEMFDAATGGGFDGLTAGGANLNQGAESTLAYLATMVELRSLAPVLVGSRANAPGAAGQAAASAARSWETDAVAAPTHRSAAP